jgi:hypothetical protein
MHLIIPLHPHQYPTSLAQVRFISILLSSMAIAWFAPLLEHQSLLFNNFEAFFEEFNATFGDLDKKHMFNINI